MPLGLYLDLAVGVTPDGAEAWADRDSIVAGASLGAPPDEFNEAGQNWGLAPLSPRALRERAYAPIIEILRSGMRHAGALRIDHILGLQRSFWWPADGAPGAYVRQPVGDLLGVVALESHRQRCVVVGEDLGTVPGGLRRLLDRDRRAGLQRALLRARGGRQLSPAGGLPVALGRLDRHPRSADARGLLGRPRHRLARAAGSLRRSGPGRRGSGARGGPSSPPCSVSSKPRACCRRGSIRARHRKNCPGPSRSRCIACSPAPPPC